MQKFFTAAFFVAFLGLQSSAQTGLLLKYDTVTNQALDTLNFVDMYNYIINETGSTVTMRWTRTLEQPWPFGWITNFCDFNLCYLAQVTTADFDFEDGDTSLLKPVIYPYGNIGTGVYRIKLESLTPSVPYLVNIVYTLTVTSATGTVEVEEARDLALFPNPAGDVLNVVFADPDFRGALRVIDATGREVLSQNAATANEQLGVADLPPGLYVLQAWTADGKLSVSKNFSKQ